MPEWLNYNADLVRLSGIPLKEQLINLCPSAYYVEENVTVVNDYGSAVNYTYYRCRYLLRLEVADKCDKVIYHFNLTVYNKGPYFNRPLFKNQGLDNRVYVHAGNLMDIVVPEQSFTDLDITDALKFKLQFADDNMFENTWIKFNPFINRIYGQSTFKAMQPDVCKLITFNNTFQEVEIYDGSKIWIKQKVCVYSMNLVVSDAITVLTYPFYICLYNNIPYLYQPILHHNKNQQQLEVHVKQKMDFYIPQATFLDLDRFDKLAVDIK